jgi:hypothetical protein
MKLQLESYMESLTLGIPTPLYLALFLDALNKIVDSCDSLQSS